MALLTKKEAGEILGRSERTINEWVQQGVLRMHTVKKTQYIDSDTVYALKDTEADITHALEERKKFYDGLKAELDCLRERELYNREPVRYAFMDLAETLDVLCDREKRVLCDVMNGYSFEEIGDGIGLTCERVRQIFYKALRRINNSIKSYRKMLNETIELRRLKGEVQEKNQEIRRLRKILNMPEPKPNDEMRKLLCAPLESMGLTTRARNCLEAVECKTLGDLVQYTRADLLKFRNFGKKSLTELDDLLERNGLAWGSDIHELLNS